MRLFRNTPKERPLTTMLREMEHGRFLEAWRALNKDTSETVYPPHALSRLGRWLADHDEAKKALLPLRRFLDTYPQHLDRPQVAQGLTLCLRHLGKLKEAERVEKQG
ncbi:MAG: hypothetical protein AAGD14_03315 [Planctomycetota bacterium]